MNMRIYNRMRQTSLSTVRSRSSSTKKASNLAAVLIVIVAVFLISNTPRLILNLTEYSVHSIPAAGCDCDTTPTWFSITISINHLLLTTNSSINFLIYCSVGEKFKAVVKKIYLKKGEETTDVDTSSESARR